MIASLRVSGRFAACSLFIPRVTLESPELVPKEARIMTALSGHPCIPEVLDWWVKITRCDSPKPFGPVLVTFCGLQVCDEGDWLLCCRYALRGEHKPERKPPSTRYEADV